MLQTAPDRAWYGCNHVEKANAQQAIHILMVTDGLFRAANLSTRRRYVALVESAKENGAEVMVFSSMHVSGHRLAQLSGVAAILRFPVPDDGLGDDSSSESSDDDGRDGGEGRSAHQFGIGGSGSSGGGGAAGGD